MFLILFILLAISLGVFIGLFINLDSIKNQSAGIVAIVVAFLISVSLGISLYLGTRVDTIKYYEMKITDYKEFKNKIIIEVEGKEVLVKDKIEWRNPEHIFKKISTDRFGDSKEEYVLEKN